LAKPGGEASAGADPTHARNQSMNHRAQRWKAGDAGLALLKQGTYGQTVCPPRQHC
jgi:hypothetical protein